MKRKQMVLVTLAAVVAALVGGMLGGWLFAPVPVQAQEEASELRTISVSNLQLVDEEGRIVGELSANGGEPHLWLEDSEGGCVDLETGGGEASCRTFADEKLSSFIGTDGFLLLDESGAKMEVGFNNNGQPEFRTFDSESELVTSLGPLGLLLSSEEGTKLHVVCNDDGIGLMFIDRYGNMRNILTKEGLTFYNTSAEPQVLLGVFEEQGSLIFLDSAGNVIWGAP